MIIPITTFTGEFPRMTPTTLPNRAAQLAIDCDFLRGSLAGVLNNEPVAGLSGVDAKSLFVYDGGAGSGTTYLWDRDVDAVRSPVVNDQYARFYWADGANFYVSRGDVGGDAEPSESNRYKVGVPRPASAMAMVNSEFRIDAAATYTLVDERADGTLTNGLAVTPVAVSQTSTGAVWTFNARAPEAVTGTGTVVTEGVETTVDSPFIGPALKVVLTRADGAVVTAMIRASSSQTTWPTEWPGYFASLGYSAGVYTLRIGASESQLEQRAYTYTYVNQYGEEGPPAAPLDIEGAAITSLTLSYTVPPTGYCPISKIRVYRTATGTVTDYLFVGEVAVNAVTPQFVDDVLTESLGETLATQNYYPPDQTLRGLCMMANGIMAGFLGNEVWFSEPYLPYAYNPAAIKPFKNRVVGICPFEGGLYVTTTTNPYIVMGAAPENMTDARVPAIQAGVSKGSIVDMGAYVAYASHDGIVSARGLDASLDASFKFFTRNEWRSRYGNKLAHMRLAAHDGSLLVWFDDGTPGFMMRFEEEAPSLTQLSAGITAAFVHPLADALYVSNGSSIYEFRAATTRKALTWWSKDFTLPPTNFSALQLIGTGTLNVSVYADGVLTHTEMVTLTDSGQTVRRLPSGFLARRWSVKFVGSATLESAILVTAIAELKNV